MDYGARTAIVLAILPTPVMLPLFAFHKKGMIRASDRVMLTTTETATGKAKTFPPIATQTKLSQRYMMHLLLLPLMDGGQIFS